MSRSGNKIFSIDTTHKSEFYGHIFFIFPFDSKSAWVSYYKTEMVFCYQNCSSDQENMKKSSSKVAHNSYVIGFFPLLPWAAHMDEN